MDAQKEQEVSIDLGNINGKTVRGRILHSGLLQDHNSFENPEKIKPAIFNNIKMNGKHITVKMPAFSVVVLEIK
jgi:alpha-N-arabinofuranosidase